MAATDMPATWVSLEGETMTRTAAMDDSAWLALLTSQGWTPGASNPASGSPATQTPAQVMALIAQGIATFGTLFSSIHGVINGVDPLTGIVSTETGNVPIADIGTVTGQNLNVTPPVVEKGFLDKPMNLALIGGGLIVLLLVMKK